MRADRRSGEGSKFNSRSGWVSLLGEVLDLCELGSTDAASEVCEKSSTDAASEIFDFCDTLFWGVAAGLSLGSLLLSLGGASDPCETRSIAVPLEQCARRSRDIGAEFILSGVRLSKRAWKGSPSPNDGGTVFSLRIL